MNGLKKILGIVFGLLFIYAAAVQFNDPDSTLWIVLYALAAFASFLFAFGRLKILWPIILMLVYAGYAIYSWPEQFEGVALQDGMKTLNIELGRESLGMAISAVVMLIYVLMLRTGKKS
jgi:Ca2+/Na+ antiporter